MSSFTDSSFADLCRHEPGDTVPFYQAEGQILELWDHLQELKLEQALLEAQIALQSEDQPATDKSPEEQLKDAEKEHIEARAAYLLRESTLEDVLISNPMLNAVHAGPNATLSERQLHPLVDRRDALGIAQANLSSTLQSVRKEATPVEADNLKTMAKNRTLTATMLDYSTKIQALRDEVVKDAGLKDQVDEAREDAGTAKKNWRIMKHVAAAVIAGSGVNWAGDDDLRDLVLDTE